MLARIVTLTALAVGGAMLAKQMKKPGLPAATAPYGNQST